VNRQQRARAGNSRSAQQEQQEHLGTLCMMMVMMMRRRCLQQQRARADLRRRCPNVIPFQQARQHQQQEL
jgi:hypothetical protein